MDQKKLSAIFGKFAGREVAMAENIRHMNIGGKDYKFKDICLADKNAPVIKGMEAAAARHGLYLRLRWPGMGAIEDDYWRRRTNRVNAYIVKGSDGKWHIFPGFNIG